MAAEGECGFIAAVEAGGTTFKVAIAQGHPTNIIASTDFPTTSPDETLGRAVAWLNEQIALGRRFNSIGIASFGPVDLRRGSDTYGYITTTPKPGWQNTPVYSRFLSFGVPVGFDTDVNGAALSELAYGGHLRSGGDVESVTKMGSCCYITVGTGVGVGIAVDGRPVHGHQHPEGGHIFIPPHADDITSGFKGKCPFHGGNCVEGMVRSDAIAARLGLGIEDLGSVEDSHPIWGIVAHYLAALCLSLTLLASPDVIVLGGGVLKRTVLFDLIRTEFAGMLNGYVSVPPLHQYIVASPHAAAGTVGALEIALRALKEAQL